MLGESLRVPFRADDWIGTILVGSVLTLLTGLLVVLWVVLLAVSPPIGGLIVPLVALPSFVLRGYFIGVVRSGIRGESTTDSFVQWGRLVHDGVRSTVVSAIYLVPAAVLCGLALGGGVATAVDPDGFEGPLQAIAALLILTGGFGLLLYGMVYLYVRPAARAVFATTGSVRAALDVRRVGRLSVTADYISGWLIGMGILLVGPVILLPLLVINLAVGVVSPPLAFVGVLSTILLGIGFVFITRVSAGYAVGTGSAEGVAELYPDAVEPRSTSTAQPESLPTDSQPTEVSVAVQTGRTVALDEPREPAENDTDDADQALPIPREPVTSIRPRERELSGAPVYPRDLTADSTSFTDRQTTTDSDSNATGTDPESIDTDDASSDDTASNKATRSTDAADETEFVWGPTEE